MSVGGRAGARAALLVVLVAGLAVAVLASLLIGARMMSVPTVTEALTAFDGSNEHMAIRELRLRRTVLAVLTGAAFAVAGGMIQAFTRNPLADPGILGVNAGASFAIVLGITFLGVRTVTQYLPLACAGAVLTTAVVYLIAARGAGGPSPLRLTLVGVALGAVLTGMSSAMALYDQAAFDRMRFWGAGSVADRPTETATVVLIPIIVGLVLALVCASGLNSMGLGDDTARALGVNVVLLRGGCILAITLLCGAGTAAAGPVGFVGLMVPHAIRWITGPDQRWILGLSLLAGPLLMVSADVLGRLVVWPSELQVGIVTAFLGAPILMILVRRTRASAL